MYTTREEGKGGCVLPGESKDFQGKEKREAEPLQGTGNVDGAVTAGAKGNSCICVSINVFNASLL